MIIKTLAIISLSVAGSGCDMPVQTVLIELKFLDILVKTLDDSGDDWTGTDDLVSLRSMPVSEPALLGHPQVMLFPDSNAVIFSILLSIDDNIFTRIAICFLRLVTSYGIFLHREQHQQALSYFR